MLFGYKSTSMSVPDFPNGFESWQKTHFEVVEALCYLRDLEEGDRPKSFTESVDRSATEEMYNLALTLRINMKNKQKVRKESGLCLMK
jgi:hypothetical protein